MQVIKPEITMRSGAETHGISVFTIHVIMYAATQAVFFMNTACFLAYLWIAAFRRPVAYAKCDIDASYGKVLTIVPICNEPTELVSRWISRFGPTARKHGTIMYVENYADIQARVSVMAMLNQTGDIVCSVAYSGSKAGALNQAISEHMTIVKAHDYLLFLDVDQLPHYNDLSIPMATLCSNPDVIAVQFRECFPEKGLGAFLYSCFQSVFTDIICLAKSRLSAGLILGGNFLIKTRDFIRAGLFEPTSVTEDIATTLVVNRCGKRVLYLDDFTCEGLPPQGFVAFLKQQWRYATGSLQILALLLKCRPKSGMNRQQRLSFAQLGTGFLTSLSVVANLLWPIGIVIQIKIVLLCLMLALSLRIGLRYMIGILLYMAFWPAAVVIVIVSAAFPSPFLVTAKAVPPAPRDP